METRVQRWGNSLAIRIPRTYAADTHLEENMTVDMSLENGHLIITPVHAPSWSLEELLAGITPENIHTEINTGPSLGNEDW